MGSYETLIVINAALAEEEIKALVEKFTALASANGTVESVDEWGKRRLAYPINDLTEGYFVVVSYRAAADFPAEMDRVLGITDGILRSMTTVAAAKKPAAAKEAETVAPAEAAAE
ncbi:MAG: 30S ribosomal protein S6 [Clostridia bacterium]|nr:30S ribosomal protein S6 [Clostridia bacterium]